MDSIVLRGKTFVKASKIAKELGYTSDYIGQLCRAGKIEAELVGRTWFVDEASIRDHKVSRYRSTAKATKKTLERMVIESPKDTKIIGFKSLAVRYEADQAELLPKPKKTNDAAEVVAVVSSDAATSVRIKDLTKEPKTGKLAITNATEEQPEETEAIVTLQDSGSVNVTAESEVPTVPASVVKSKVPVKDETLSQKTVLASGENIVTPQATRKVVGKSRAGLRLVAPTVTLLAALTVSALVLTATSVYTYEQQGTEVSHTVKFEFSNIQNILKNMIISF